MIRASPASLRPEKILADRSEKCVPRMLMAAMTAMAAAPRTSVPVLDMGTMKAVYLAKVRLRAAMPEPLMTTKVTQA